MHIVCLNKNSSRTKNCKILSTEEIAPLRKNNVQIPKDDSNPVKCSLCGRVVSYRRYADHDKSKNCKAPPKYMNNNSNSIGASVVTDHCPMNVSTSKNDGAFSTVPAPVILVPDSEMTTASTNNVKKKSWRDDG